MSILSGLIKEKVYKKIANGYKLISRYTDSDTVKMPDGNTATTNLGNIHGITSSPTANDPNIAVGSDLVYKLNSNLAAANITKSIFTSLPGAVKTTGVKATVNYSGYNYINLNFADANSAYNFGKVSIDAIKRTANNIYQINSGAGSGSGVTDGRGNVLRVSLETNNMLALSVTQLDSYSMTYGVFVDAWLSVF